MPEAQCPDIIFLMVLNILEKVVPQLRERRLVKEKKRSEGNKLVTSLSESVAERLQTTVPLISDETFHNVNNVYSDESADLDTITNASTQFFSALNGANPELSQMIDSICEIQDYSMESYDIYRNYLFFLLSSMVVGNADVQSLDTLRVAAIANIGKVPRVSLTSENAVLNGIYNVDLGNYESDRSTLDIGLKQMEYSLSKTHPHIKEMMDTYLTSWESLLPIHTDHFDELSTLTFSVLGSMCLSSDK